QTTGVTHRGRVAVSRQRLTTPQRTRVRGALRTSGVVPSAAPAEEDVVPARDVSATSARPHAPPAGVSGATASGGLGVVLVRPRVHARLRRGRLAWLVHGGRRVGRRGRRGGTGGRPSRLWRRLPGLPQGVGEIDGLLGLRILDAGRPRGVVVEVVLLRRRYGREPEVVRAVPVPTIRCLLARLLRRGLRRQTRVGALADQRASLVVSGRDDSADRDRRASCRERHTSAGGGVTVEARTDRRQ